MEMPWGAWMIYFCQARGHHVCHDTACGLQVASIIEYAQRLVHSSGVIFHQAFR
jgi:hypothetical protein